MSMANDEQKHLPNCIKELKSKAIPQDSKLKKK